MLRGKPRFTKNRKRRHICIGRAKDDAHEIKDELLRLLALDTRVSIITNMINYELVFSKIKSRMKYENTSNFNQLLKSLSVNVKNINEEYLKRFEIHCLKFILISLEGKAIRD